MKNVIGSWFGFLFAVVWIGGIAFADGGIAVGVWRAVQSANWPTTPGTVTDSHLQTQRKSVTLFVRYTYTVHEQEHTGTRYDDGPAFLPKQKWPKAQSELPVGSSVTVYYDPAAPATAVLHPGLGPEILPTVLAFVPFNLVAVFLGSMAWNAIRCRRGFDPARDVQPAPAGLIVRLNGFGRLGVFGVALFVLSLVGTFGVAVLLHSVWEIPPSWLLDGAILGGMVLASGLIVAKWGAPRYLVEGLNGFTVPTTPTGQKMTDLPRAAIKHVDVQTETRRGGKGRTYEVHVVSLVVAEGRERHTVRFAEYHDLVDARALADWLLERLGKKPKE